MTTTTPLTEKELVMFLGCECEVTNKDVSENPYYSTINTPLLSEMQEDGEYISIKPILTRLEDMSEVDETLLNEFVNKIRKKHPNPHYALYLYSGLITTWHTERGYDIFGYLNENKAINKKTLK